LLFVNRFANKLRASQLRTFTVTVASPKPAAGQEVDLRTVFTEAFDAGWRDCKAANGDRSAFDPALARQHPDYGEALIEAYESGWRSALRA
jgi:hypothetical protein